MAGEHFGDVEQAELHKLSRVGASGAAGDLCALGNFDMSQPAIRIGFKEGKHAHFMGGDFVALHAARAYRTSPSLVYDGSTR